MRHIGIWKNEADESSAVAELVINGNNIEFYHRNAFNSTPQAYISTDSGCSYKIVTDGMCNYGKFRTLDNVSSLKVSYVIEHNHEFQKGLHLNNIKELSFDFPELDDWLQLDTVGICTTKTGELAVVEKKNNNIILKEANPRIEIAFERGSSFFGLPIKNKNELSVSNKPRIVVSYDKLVDFQKAYSDINAIMQFFSLTTGRVSEVTDIRLRIQGEEIYSKLYINKDFSYNLTAIGIFGEPLTTLQGIGEKLTLYFEKWYSFFYDENFDLIRSMYFDANRNKEQYASDVFVQYIRILEGYHLRVNGDEKISDELKKQIRMVENEIKNLIFDDNGKAIFIPVLKNVLPEWEFNSSHSADIASWIAGGFLSRKSLSSRLKDLDNEYFNIISKNAENIRVLGKDDIDGFDYYRCISDTRNYYSHYKADKRNVLNCTQICDSIKVLKALIIMIMFNHMGMEKDEIRNIIIKDKELNFQTKCLRK